MSNKNKLVEVFVDEDSEMIRIDVAGKTEFEGNFLDITEIVWIDIMRQAGLKVNKDSYQYDDGSEEELDEDEEEE